MGFRTVTNNFDVHEAVIMSTKQMKECECGWPSQFYATISQHVNTAEESKKHIVIGTKKLYDTTMIFSKVIGIQASSRDIDTKTVFSHALAPVRKSMFEDSGANVVMQRKV